MVDATRDAGDVVTGIAAVHALAVIPGPAADRALADVLRSDRRGALPAHAAWAISRRARADELLEPLVDCLIDGHLAGMHAQVVLVEWARFEPSVIAGALRRALTRTNEANGRRALIETLGLVPDDGVLRRLAWAAVDRGESDLVRLTAVAALGDRLRSPFPRSVAALAEGVDRVADAVRLAEWDRRSHGEVTGPRSSRELPGIPAPTRGVRVAQVHLGAFLDADLLHSGVGDTGGVATLLVRLGAALDHTPHVTEVVTIGRGTVRDVLDGSGQLVEGPRFAPVALEPEAGTAFSDRWPARVAAERGLRRVIRVHGRPDVVHLRMADVGSLAAADVAARSGIPTVFSLAPDPHGLIASREMAGDLDRRSFGDEDARVHLWFRAHLVERLAREADHVALFPREGLIEQLRDLVGVDITSAPGRFTVVPEGIDVARIRRAAAIAEAQGDQRPMTGALAELLDRIAALPPDRHGLPIVLTVGRLSELKGMARLAEAFAADPALRSRANLVIVGGDLDHPTPTEATELDRIQAAQAVRPDLGACLVLLGHQPHPEIAYLLAAVRYGARDVIGPNGAYACASRKEEFGLAVVEALAAGLPVVAPLSGGPATYVEHGRTGFLVDTGDPAALAVGVSGALDLADRPGRAGYAARTIASRYDISNMARAMTSIYRRVVEHSRDSIAS